MVSSISKVDDDGEKDCVIMLEFGPGRSLVSCGREADLAVHRGQKEGSVAPRNPMP